VLTRRSEFGRELDEEIRLHREMKARELVARGLAEEGARYVANRAVGNALSLSERGREAWGWRWLEDLAQDLRFGARMLRKNPGFAATAVLTLALGIGANTAIFSVVNGVLLRQLPYSDPERLVWAGEYWPRINDEVVPNPDYTNWKLNNRDFEALGAFDSENQMNITGAGEPERVESVLVTANFTSVLAVQPSLGLSFWLPSLMDLFFRGSHTTNFVTCGFNKSYNQAAEVPSSKVTCTYDTAVIGAAMHLDG